LVNETGGSSTIANPDKPVPRCVLGSRERAHAPRRIDFKCTFL
jgi:hypothetical protein